MGVSVEGALGEHPTASIVLGVRLGSPRKMLLLELGSRRKMSSENSTVIRYSIIPLVSVDNCSTLW